MYRKLQKKSQNKKPLQGTILEETIIETNRESVQKVNSGCLMNSVSRMHEQCAQEAISQRAKFLVAPLFLHFLLFFPSGL